MRGSNSADDISDRVFVYTYLSQLKTPTGGKEWERDKAGDTYIHRSRDTLPDIDSSDI